MRRIVSGFLSRLRANQRGETLAETLVAILISSLSLLMLATAVSGATNIVLRAQRMAEAYINANNDLAEATVSGSGTVSVTDISDTSVTKDITYTKSAEDFPGARVGIAYKYKDSVGGGS